MESNSTNSINSKEKTAICVLGRGFECRGENKDRPYLPMEPSMRVLAACIESINQDVKTILFTGGKVHGPNHPSEAEIMSAKAKKMLKHRFKDERNVDHILETESLDSSENAEKIIPLLKENNISEIILIANGAHTKRAEKLFKRYGITVKTAISAEDVLSKYHENYADFFKKYNKSITANLIKTREGLYSLVLLIDKKNKIPRFCAHLTRGRG